MESPDDTRLLLNSPNKSPTSAGSPEEANPRLQQGKDLYRSLRKQSLKARSQVVNSSIGKALISKSSDATSFIARQPITEPAIAKLSKAKLLIDAIPSGDSSDASPSVTRRVIDTYSEFKDNTEDGCQAPRHDRIPPWSSWEQRETAPVGYCQDTLCFKEGKHDYWLKVCTDCTRTAKGARWDYTALKDPQRTLWLNPLCDNCEGNIRRFPQEVTSCKCVEEFDRRQLCPAAVDRALQKMQGLAKSRLDWMMMQLAESQRNGDQSVPWSWQGDILCRCWKPIPEGKKRAMWCMVCSHTVLVEPTTNADRKWYAATEEEEEEEEETMADESTLEEYEMI